jgi:Glycosyl transferase family 2
MPTRDITAVVLTLGEHTTGRALASLRAQTLAPGEVTLVRRVRPFHRALNVGAARVRTPFLLQLDSDMVLDPDCLERLRSAMTPEIGIVVGPLRDPVMGKITGVKLFRTACLVETSVRDSMTPDVDHYVEIGQRGLLTQSLLPTVGAHLPDYTPAYTYGTYRQMGMRYRYRRDLRGLHWRYTALRGSRHPMALVARAAFGHGLFSRQRREAPKEPPARGQLEVVRELARRRAEDASHTAIPLTDLDAFELGRRLRSERRYAAARSLLETLGREGSAETWATEAGFCHGLLGTSAAWVDSALA